MSMHPDFQPKPTELVYEAVAQHIAARIETGELKPDEPLPSERRLAHEYGVSLGSARHATRLLRYRGLVVTVRSKGTYVAERPAREEIAHARGPR
ncbi:winged helix-turn-helix domain-containing protein [Amycolatopsis alkalitolerans]|uniref:Winged helix-turn-helix transcriptional regulator n=1 Tax=Amycolatopsis alkalitolerans TaxID=2547244 RepID=A0A5C4M0W2_9PSEU|nr:winged helix-turn-helix domain-containing protein [Amycolatopsis alkalitolerans]TNC24335.1 winged helix-turn-helix transcriptional regulator [Amycolatopsis alkalitolerans]